MRPELRRAWAGLAALLALFVTTACTGSGQSDDSNSSPERGVAAAENTGYGAIPGIVDEIEPSVVTIRTGAGVGSGIVYDSDGTIVTAAHVIEGKRDRPLDEVKVTFADGQSAKAEVVAVDNVTDIGVVKAERDGLPVPAYADGLPQVGQLTVVVGSPMGLSGTVTAGIVSALHRKMPASEENPQGLIGLIQVDAPISPGNSGGAAVNGDGTVIGMSEAYLPPKSGAVAIGFVTPATTLTDVADELIDHGEASHAYLGARPANITPQVAKRLNLPESSGVVVVEVVDSGPAADAGLQSGDIITKVDDTSIDKVIDLLTVLRKHEPGDEVALTVTRGDGQESITVNLGDRADIGD